MRFLDDQAAARRRTRLCLALLALVVLLMALASAGEMNCQAETPAARATTSSSRRDRAR